MKVPKKLKAFGIALLVIASVGASSAAEASAAVFRTPAEGMSVNTVSGVQVEELKLTTSAGVQKCSTATFSGSFAGGSTEALSLQENNGGCKLYGRTASYVGQLGWELHVPTLDHGYVSFTSPATITIPAWSCDLTIPAGQQVEGLKFTNENESGTKYLHVAVQLTGIKYTESAGCPAPGTRSNGALAGSINLKSTNEAASPWDLWAE
jgi:hypothetical protein